MSFNTAHIIIDTKRVRIVDGGQSYDDTVDNTVTYSGDVFVALPVDVIRYEKKTTGQEFWVKQSVTGDLKQESPTLSYRNIIEAMVGDLTGLIDAKMQATTPPFTTDADEREVIKLGSILTIVITYDNPTLPETLTVEVSNFETSILTEVEIDTNPDTIELQFIDLGGYEVKFNNVLVCNAEVQQP